MNNNEVNIKEPVLQVNSYALAIKLADCFLLIVSGSQCRPWVANYLCNQLPVDDAEEHLDVAFMGSLSEVYTSCSIVTFGTLVGVFYACVYGFSGSALAPP